MNIMLNNVLINTMKIKLFLLCTIFGIVATSCETTSGEPTGLGVETENFISCYKYLTGVKVVFPQGTSVLVISDTSCAYLTDGQLDSIRTKYDDTHYNGWTLNPRIAYANEFTGVTVTSDQEFNGIPAGENIGSLIKIISISPYKWLLSKGTFTFDWSNPPVEYDGLDGFLITPVRYTAKQYHPVVKVLTELNKEDLLLLDGSNDIILRFTETPEIKHHNLTVTFYDTKGSFSATVDATFD
jgi:hypothetical protein